MFKGYYFKHQNLGKTLCFIVGEATSGNFLQVITNEKVYRFDDFSQCEFSKDGVKVNLPNIKGEIKYSNLTPLKNSIMGPFQYLPMQCKHSVVSMSHDLNGSICIDGENVNFTGGIGYIEGDRGRSFPKKYLWLHCNDFAEKCSIMVSVADIPFVCMNFMGCICAIIYKGIEYRLATYKNVKIIEADKNNLYIIQGRYKLLISIEENTAHPLASPQKGQMSGIVHESNNCSARFQFFESGKAVFDLYSNNTSFECNL